jgi:phosphoribosylformylglycinamidine (FGAM) synthase-like enzyme
VLSIEVMPAGAGDAASAAGSTGSTGATGATGASGAAGAGQAYVITLQMDDGSTRKVTQEAVPDFRSGDRVNMTDGMIHR